MGFGVGELGIILVIVIIVFGASRLPMIGSGIGRGITNFKKEMKKVDSGKEKASSDSIEENTANEEEDTEKEATAKKA